MVAPNGVHASTRIPAGGPTQTQNANDIGPGVNQPSSFARLRNRLAWGAGRSPPKIARCNWVKIERAVSQRPVITITSTSREYGMMDMASDTVSGSYVLDPGLHVDEAVLAPLDGAAQRPNLDISTRTGRIDIDLWIVSPSLSTQNPAGRPARVAIYLEAATVSLRIHSMGECLIDVLIDAARSVDISLPRAFSGTLRMNTLRRDLSMSPAIAKSIMFAYDGPESVTATLDLGPHNRLNRPEGSQIVASEADAKINLRLSNERRKFLGLLWPSGR